ncbi:MAG: hypothetical protein P1P64_10180 [Treponemataceae bacterium]
MKKLFVVLKIIFFYLYDSIQEKKGNTRKTVIDKRCLAENRYYTSDELVKLWNNGRDKIFYNN